MIKKIAPAFILVVIIAAVSAAAQANKPLKPQSLKPSPPPVPTVTAVLKVASPVTNINGDCAGKCPVTIHFAGTIQVNMACTMQYRFVRSDGLVGSTATLNCGAAGSYAVKDEWIIGKAFSGWELIEVLSPVSLKSDKAVFHLACVAGPVITGAQAYGWILNIDGENIVSLSANQDITINGKSVRNTPGYSIEAGFSPFGGLGIKYPNDLLPFTPYSIAVTESGKTISNVYTGQFKYCLDTQLEPATPGSVFGVRVYQLPASSGGMGIRLTSQSNPGLHYDVSLVSWSGGPSGLIKAWVPADIVLSVYWVALMKGGTSVSYLGEGKSTLSIHPPK